jgi:hypothetical protein
MGDEHNLGGDIRRSAEFDRDLEKSGALDGRFGATVVVIPALILSSLFCLLLAAALFNLLAISVRGLSIATGTADGNDLLEDLFISLLSCSFLYLSGFLFSRRNVVGDSNDKSTGTGSLLRFLLGPGQEALKESSQSIELVLVLSKLAVNVRDESPECTESSVKSTILALLMVIGSSSCDKGT